MIIQSVAPVLLIAWKRPKELLVSLKSISRVKPSKLYLACDGPAKGDCHNEALVKEVRELLDSSVDWDCEVHKRYLDANQGCKIGVSSAIDWFFSHEEYGIIIEDDVVCDPSFFTFASEMLLYYRDIPQVGCITANSFTVENGVISDNSYVFSTIPHIWGWATWKRVWNSYDPDLSSLDPVADFVFLLRKYGFRFSCFWIYTFIKVKNQRIDTWDYQLTYAFLKNNLLCIMPTVELCKNIGYGADASHTTSGKSPLLDSVCIEFPLRHPQDIYIDIAFEKKKLRSNFLPKKIHRKLIKHFLNGQR